MSQLTEKIRAKVMAPTLGSFATITAEGKPWTRYVVVQMDDDFTLWFATFKESRKAGQLAANPEAHLCLGVDDMMKAESWLQIQGKAVILDDHDTRHQRWHDMLQSIFSGPDDPNYVVCKMTPYRIEYLCMETRQPEVWEPEAGC